MQVDIEQCEDEFTHLSFTTLLLEVNTCFRKGVVYS